MIKCSLERSGNAPLQFTGTLVAESEGRSGFDGRDHNRYHNIRIYRTQSGNHIVSVQYRTRYQGEDDHDYAEVAGQNPAGVTEKLMMYNSTELVTTYPEYVLRV